ncbi:MAG: PQQ-dependent sugar dehydrogenase [Bacteroidota bacterium]|nr:PQQ-dependent sugar dehydrogenase [Bacteroidota bacterium]
MKNIFILLVLFVLSDNTIVKAQINILSLAKGFKEPTSIAHANDSRLFIVEKVGRIAIIDTNGNVNSNYFLEIESRVKSSGGEQGLLGLAFHPNFSNNGYFYVNYTDNDDSTTVSRFKISGQNPSQADANSEIVLLKIHQPFTNHNGGEIKFGPDGFLYIATGDGGGAGDPNNNAQNPLTMLGKILRIDVNQGAAYGIPSSNPFVGTSDTLDEIWALGLRNPWRFSFDRLNNDLWIADVGQNAWEEINMHTSQSAGGKNYGWPCYEGDEPFNTSGCAVPSKYVFPIFTYENTGFSGDCSVTGGYMYRGEKYSNLSEHYFYGDYCSGKIWSINNNAGTWQNQYYGEFDLNISSFGEDAKGELYVADLNQGEIFKIEGDVSKVKINLKKKMKK